MSTWVEVSSAVHRLQPLLLIFLNQWLNEMMQNKEGSCIYWSQEQFRLLHQQMRMMIPKAPKENLRVVNICFLVCFEKLSMDIKIRKTWFGSSFSRTSMAVMNHNLNNTNCQKIETN